MIKAIVIGHGDLATSLVKAAEKIVGPQDSVEVISNLGLSGDALCSKIIKASRKTRKEQIIFVDLPGGSCTISCLRAIKRRNTLPVICGMNLPMLLEFFLLRDKYTTKELVTILIKKAKANIFRLGEGHG